MKKALITGITGQDGSYLAEFLLEKGYEVHGIIRRSSSINTKRIDHIYDRLILHYGDMTDTLSIDRLVYEIKPCEIYHLAAQSHVKVSFELPEYTGEVGALGTLKLIESVKKHCINSKIYNACTSELYGLAKEIPQNENTPFCPRSPYAISKLYSYWIAKNYRESYNMFICNGILFNHESERRGETFVTRKITMSLAEIKNKLKQGDFTFNKLKLGNLYSKRDWGYAKDYVYGMWLIMQQDKPDDFVLATNETHTIKEFIEESCKICEFDLTWEGEYEEEKGLVDGRVIIEIDKKYFRPSEVDLLIGDYTKANKILGWSPKIKFKELVSIMMNHDIKNSKKYE